MGCVRGLLLIVIILLHLPFSCRGGSLIRGALNNFLNFTDKVSTQPVEAKSWYKFIPIPSIKAKYFIPGPFQPEYTETPFNQKVCFFFNQPY